MWRIPTIGFLAALIFPQHGMAQMSDVICDASPRLQQQLEAGQSTRLGYGLRDPDTMLEIWVTPVSDSWFVVQNYANGTSCIVAMGEGWENIAPPTDPA